MLLAGLVDFESWSVYARCPSVATGRLMDFVTKKEDPVARAKLKTAVLLV